MRSPVRGADVFQPACETLEERATPALAYALSGVGAGTATLLSLDTAAPTTTPKTLTGIAGGDVLVGLDSRPADGGLYALGLNATTRDGTLYRIDPSTGAATTVGTTGGVDLSGIPRPPATHYGFDFDPTGDYIRVVFGGKNVRINPDTGLFLGSDGDVNGAATTLGGLAYAPAVGTAAALSYGIDPATDTLLKLDAAAGTTTLVGTGLGLDVTAVGGFDISQDAGTDGVGGDKGFAVLTVGGVTGLYSIDLTAGTATLVGPVGTGTADVRGFSLAFTPPPAPAGEVSFASPTYSVAESGGKVTVTLTRTGGTAGAIDAAVDVTGGTATAGTDFAGGPYAVHFAAGQTSASFDVAVTDDKVAEGAETILLAVSVTGSNGSVGSVSTAELTITDDDSSVAFASAAVSGTEGPAGVDVVFTRVGSSTGALTATVAVTGGTATEGVDFASGPYTVNFADGQTTATLNIRWKADGRAEGPETAVLTVTAVTGDNAVASTSSTTLTVRDQPQTFARAFGTAGGAASSVGVQSSDGSSMQYDAPYGAAPGGVRVALGDVTGDGLTDLVTIPVVGSPLIKVYSGATGAPVASFYAYPAAFNLPASLAVGDVNGDGIDDIVIGTNATLGAVLVFSGQTFQPLGAFMAFGGLPVGVNVAVGDTDGDGKKDIVVGTATGVGAVGVYDGTTFAQKSFFLPFGGFATGTTVAAGDLDGDGKAEIVVGTASLVPAVAVFSAGAMKTVLFPFGPTAVGAGANVGVNDINGDGRMDLVVAQTDGSGITGAFDGPTLSPMDSMLPFGGFRSGVFVA